MKLWNRFNEPERKAWHDYEKEARREQIKSIVKTVLKVALVICVVVFAKGAVDDWQNRELMREAESKIQTSVGVKDPSRSSSCQGNAPIGGGKNIDTDAIRAESPKPTAKDLERWGEPIRSTYILTYGYTPSPILLYFYGVKEVYDDAGEAVDMSVMPTANWLVTHTIYADPETSKQYIGYDGVLYLLEDNKDAVVVRQPITG